MILGQSGLGNFKSNTDLQFQNMRVAKVTSVEKLKTEGKIEVEFVKGGRPVPVHFVENVSVTPEQGDWVIVGNIDGNKNNVFFVGYFRNFYACSNYIKVSKDCIRIQLPIDDKDVLDKMIDDSKKNTRVYLELTKDRVVLWTPWSGYLINSHPEG